jgi:hypothetical protein
MSKWFYDTFTGAATGAARCGFFVGDGFGLLVVSYRGTRRFTLFRPPERNTLCPRENGVVLLKSGLARVGLSFSFFLTPVKCCLPKPFITQVQVVTMSPKA